MKATTLRLHAGISARLVPWFAAALALASAGPRLAAAPASPPATKPYTLFLGANLDVKQGQKVCRVVGVSGARLVARVHGQLRYIPTNEGLIGLRVRKAIKLQPTAATLTLTDLKVDRAYTPRNDPVRKFFRQQPGSAGVEQYDVAQGQATEADMAPIDRASPYVYPQTIAAVQAAVTAARQNASRVLSQTSTDQMYDMTDYSSMMAEEQARKLFDAIAIDFKVSSPVPLTNPYILVIAQYHDPEAAPKSIHNWIFAQQLDPIGPRPHDVSILGGGFPKGYVLKKYEIHLFNNGNELATTSSKHRMELTWEQAFDYRMMDYLSRHKGMNMPARPAMAHLPADAATRLKPGEFHRTYYVKVSKDGVPLGAFVDTACSKKVADPAVQDLIRDVRFNPQLDKGRPVAGVAPLALADLGQ